MVAWWKRLIYSLFSVVAAGSIFGVVVALQTIPANPSTRFQIAEVISYIWVLVFGSLPGWILTIPVVLIVTNIRGWRFWMYLAIGSAIGPALILGIAIFVYFSSSHAVGLAWRVNSAQMLAAAISFVATLIYLLLLRWGQSPSESRKERGQGTQNVDRVP